MTARMLATLALSLGLTVYAGCSGTDDKGDTDLDTDAGDDDDDDDVPTAETGGDGDDYFVPAAVQPSAYFGFDAATSSMVDVTTPYGTLTPSIEISIGNAEWQANNLDPNLTDLYCVVQLPLTDSSFASWAQADGYYYGVDYTDGTPLTNCTLDNGFDVDPGWTYGYGDGALAGVFALPWGVAFGPITPDGEAFIDGYTYANIPEGSFFGSAFNDPNLMEVIDGQVALATQLDENFALTTNFIAGTDVTLGNGLVTGFYETITAYYVTFTQQ